MKISGATIAEKNIRGKTIPGKTMTGGLAGLCLISALHLPLAIAEENDPWQHEQDVAVIEDPISSEQLDRLLAPIALYPDTLLSHILVASTYPLEVVQLARWRHENSKLSSQQALEAVEERDWDPSVKALAPFTELLQSMSGDLDWLESLGNAFLANESRVLDTVQDLRRRAYDEGNLSDNSYVDVEEQDEEIIIQPVRREVIYVPYYDTRVVYGHWWHDHGPYYWRHPSHFVADTGFYWSPNIFIGAGFYFSSLHWHHRHLLVDYSWRDYHRHTPTYYPHSRVAKRNFVHWRHDISHRHGVRYPRHFNTHRFTRSHSVQKHHRPDKDFRAPDRHVKRFAEQHRSHDGQRHRLKNDDRSHDGQRHRLKNDDRSHDGQRHRVKNDDRHRSTADRFTRDDGRRWRNDQRSSHEFNRRDADSFRQREFRDREPVRPQGQAFRQRNNSTRDFDRGRIQRDHSRVEKHSRSDTNFRHNRESGFSKARASKDNSRGWSRGSEARRHSERNVSAKGSHRGDSHRPGRRVMSQSRDRR